MLSILVVWLCLAAAGALILGSCMALDQGSEPTNGTEEELQACARSVHPTWWAHLPRPRIGRDKAPLERRSRDRRAGERRGNTL
jgi:hypothetical protein